MLLRPLGDDHHTPLWAGNFVAFILLAHLLTAAMIDQFGMFGIARNPLDALKLGGFVLIVFGIAVLQWADRKAAGS